jgi:ABC-type sugar transport system substrate-binding protein
MKKLVISLLVALIAFSALAACAPKQPEAIQPEPEVVEKIVEVEKEKELKEVTIGFSWNRMDSQLLVAWQDYFQSYGDIAGPKSGYKINWVFNVADGDVARQASNIQDLINQGVDLIGTRPEDAAAIGASIKAAKDAGIPVITFDRASSGFQPDAHTGADSYTQALTTGREFAKILAANGVTDAKCIEVLGDLKDMNAVNRSKGWADAQAETGAWTTVVQVPTEWNADKFYTGTANALQAYPDANCIFTASDYAYGGVEKAMQEADKLYPAGDPKHMWAASQDMNPPGLEAMEKGYIDVLTTYDAYFHSVAFVDAAIKLLNGETLGVINFLVPGRVATLDNFKDMENLWARDYR